MSQGSLLRMTAWAYFKNISLENECLETSCLKAFKVDLNWGFGLNSPRPPLTSFDAVPVDTGCKLNVQKTFRKRPGRLLNVLYTFNLRPVSTAVYLRLRFLRLWNLTKVQLTIKGTLMQIWKSLYMFVFI